MDENIDRFDKVVDSNSSVSRSKNIDKTDNNYTTDTTDTTTDTTRYTSTDTTDTTDTTTDTTRYTTTDTTIGTNYLLEGRIAKIEQREKEKQIASRISSLPEDDRTFASDLLVGLNTEQKEIVLKNYEDKIKARQNTEKPMQSDYLGGKSKEEALEEAYNLIRKGGAIGREASIRFHKIVNGG